MEDLNLDNVSIKDMYDLYIEIKILIDELNNMKKDLPPKEEL